MPKSKGSAGEGAAEALTMAKDAKMALTKLDFMARNSESRPTVSVF